MKDLLMERICAEIDKRGYGTKRLAQEAGVSEPVVTAIRKGEDVQLASLRKVCCVLDLAITAVNRSEMLRAEIAELDSQAEQLKSQLEELMKQRALLAGCIKED